MIKIPNLSKTFEAPLDLAPDHHLASALSILVLYLPTALNYLNFLEVFLLSPTLEAFAQAVPLPRMLLSSLLPVQSFMSPPPRKPLLLQSE